MFTKKHQAQIALTSKRQQWLESKPVLIVGLARNCGRMIEEEVLRMRGIFKSFSSVQFLIVESDSDDDTVTKLESLSKRVSAFRYLALGKLRHILPARTERIAFCRNRYLEEIKTNQSYENIEYVVVADFDGVNKLLTEEALFSCWLRDDWHACTANQRGPYYDIWALRHEVWCPGDCWEQFEFLVEKGVSRNGAQLAAISSKMIVLSEAKDWVLVKSAFGGLAIYQKGAFIEGKYGGTSLSGRSICEHVPFHEALVSKGYRILINPRLINNSYTEHTKHLRPVERFKGIAKNQLKDLFAHLPISHSA